VSKPNVEITREDRAFVMTMVFDAPREIVWRVYTNPAAIPRWWGPRRLTTAVDKMDVRVGGQWRYIQTDAGGTQYAFHGAYLVVDAPNLLVSTFEFEGMPGHVMTDHVTFRDLPDGRTQIIARSSVESHEAIEALVQPGMEEGALETWERFGETLQAVIAGSVAA
jgi:uncharacterized protein YndB with AHSA1/START domain